MVSTGEAHIIFPRSQSSMNSISPLKNLKTLFTRSKMVNAFYVVSMLVILSGTVTAAGYSLSFFLKQFNELFIVSDEGSSGVSSFDMNGISAIAPKLQIPLTDIIAPKNQTPATEIPTLPAKEGVLAPSSPLSLPTVPVSLSEEQKPLDRSLISIEIQNGTAITGLAADWKARFEKEGFDKITIGNAEKRDYIGVHIFTRAKDEELAKAIRAVFASEKQTIAEETLDPSLKTDVRIIIGKDGL